MDEGDRGWSIKTKNAMVLGCQEMAKNNKQHNALNWGDRQWTIRDGDRQ